MPKQLLLLSYFFPPFGGAGVQRALKLCKAAPDLGWQVSVIACAPDAADSQDPSMLPEVPPDMHVERTPAIRIYRLGSWAGRWTPGDPYLGWVPFAADAARELARNQHFDAVMSTSMPYCAHWVAREIREVFGLPWLCDLRDPWTDNRFMAHYSSRAPYGWFRRWIDAWMERQVYADADAVTVTAEPLRQLLIDKHGLPASKVSTVRNGYDEADFAGVLPMPAVKHPLPPGLDQRMTLMFAGSMYEGYTIEPFMAAWDRLLQERPDLRLSLVTHTNNTGQLNRLTAKFPRVAPFVEPGPRVSHTEIVRRYAAADLMVLSALDDLSTPGKLFEYMRSGSPVLVFAVPHAEARDLIAGTGTGSVAPHDDPAAGAAILGQLYDRWLAGLPLCVPDAQAVAQLERRVAFAKLFRVLDDLAGG